MVKMLVARLKAPPIVEVVCGFFFSPITGLDPITIGKYWAEHKEKAGHPPFPKKQLMPPVTDRPSFVLGDGVGPLRCWLVSESEEYLLQIQPDRFYFNWRKREGEYPHFNTRDGKDGVLARGLREFEEFGKFCGASLGQTPKAVRLELAKIDLLEQGKHFTDFTDLASLLPVVQQAMKITKSSEPMLHLKLSDFRDGHDIQFQLTTAVLAADMKPALQLETRATADVGEGSLNDKFVGMNAIINEVFFGLIADAELSRFGGKLQ